MMKIFIFVVIWFGKFLVVFDFMVFGGGLFFKGVGVVVLEFIVVMEKDGKINDFCINIDKNN